MSFTSGTQALQGRTINHDPEPYVGTRGRQRIPYGLGTEAYVPRPEFAVLDNPILAQFRAEESDWANVKGFPITERADNWAQDIADGEIYYDRPPEERTHARRVLTKLAAFTKEES